MTRLDLAVEDERWNDLGSVEEIAEKAIAAALAQVEGADPEKRIPKGQISLLLANDIMVQDMNLQWRGLNKPTNVLSFPLPLAFQDNILGDIVLGYETILHEAEAERKTLHDHVVHLIVHGVLHLLGYDHQNDEEARAMENLEIKALASMGISDPYGES